MASDRFNDADVDAYDSDFEDNEEKKAEVRQDVEILRQFCLKTAIFGQISSNFVSKPN